MRIAISVFLCSAFLSISAQSVNYNDVGVIVNANSPTSMQIGAYFMQARNIPANRLITIIADTSINIPPIDFLPIQAQVEAHLQTYQLVDSLNYLVTTKGVPLRLDNGGCAELIGSRCSSLDTELALILGPLANGIVAQGLVLNPFAGSVVNHQRSTHGIYLVSRLSAPTLNDVIALIDRSGSGIGLDTTAALLVGDLNVTDTTSGVQGFFEASLQNVMAPFTNDGWNTLMDYGDDRLDDLEHVLTYMGMNYPDVDWHPSITWTPGAIAVEWHMETALDQSLSGVSIAQQRIARHMTSGATVALGSVGILYANPWFQSGAIMQRYLDPTLQFNAAEAIYAFIPHLSWNYQMIGDPKTSIILIGPSSVEASAPIPSLSIHPNPSSGYITISSPGIPFKVDLVTDVFGRTVSEPGTMLGESHSLDLSHLPPGTYLVQSSTMNGQRRLCSRVVVQPN